MIPSLWEQTSLLLLAGLAIGIVTFAITLRHYLRGGSKTFRFIATVAFIVALVSGLAIERGYVRTLHGPNVIALDALEPVDTEDRIPTPHDLLSPETNIPTLTIRDLDMISYRRDIAAGSLDPFPKWRDLQDSRRLIWVGKPSNGRTQEKAVEDVVNELEDIVGHLAQRSTNTSGPYDSGAFVITPASEPEGNPYWITATVEPLDNGNIEVMTYLTIKEGGLHGHDPAGLIPAKYQHAYEATTGLTGIGGLAFLGWRVDDLQPDTIQFFYERADDLPRHPGGSCDELREDLNDFANSLKSYDPTIMLPNDSETGGLSFRHRIEGDEISFVFKIDCRDGQVDNILYGNFVAHPAP